MFTLNNITESAPATTRPVRETRPARRPVKFSTGETLADIQARIDAGDHPEYRLSGIVEA